MIGKSGENVARSSLAAQNSRAEIHYAGVFCPRRLDLAPGKSALGAYHHRNIFYIITIKGRKDLLERYRAVALVAEEKEVGK